MKKALIIIVGILLIFSISACKKKEEQTPLPQTQVPMMPGGNMPQGQMPPAQMPPSQMPMGQMPPSQMPPAQMPQTQMPPAGQPGMIGKVKTQVVVPPSVKGQWSGAKLIVEDKIAKTKQEYTVKLNSDFNIPNTNLKVHVGDFLPEIKFEGTTITSSSNQPNNPALSVRIYENNKQIFPDPKTGKQWAWLFSKVPTMHAFVHPKYGIILKEGIKKG